MAAGRGNLHEDAPGADLYAVLGLRKECTDAELRVAYRRLAMRWHPDRCSASGSAARVEEAKERFQEIQGAYSVLSDSNKRFLYDVGVYDTEDDDDDLSGMGDFLGEMADMMSQATPTESFEELQQLFVDMFQGDLQAGLCGGPRPGARAQTQSPACTSLPPQSSSPLRPPPGRCGAQAPPPRNGASRRGSSPMGAGKPSRPGRAGLGSGLGLSGFRFKVTESRQRQAPAPWTWSGGVGEGRSGRKQRLSTSRDVSDGGEVSGVFRQSRSTSWQ
ncbi:hypothetical protein ACP70R_042448 [Stipagrostis hirtigluma subsp. patula]